MNTKQEVMENLQMVDEYLPAMFPHVDKLSFIVTGGASFLLKGYTNKVTLDIDSITTIDENVLSFLESFSINNAASEVTPLSSTYTERLTKVRGGFNVLDELNLDKLFNQLISGLTHNTETSPLKQLFVKTLCVNQDMVTEPVTSYEIKEIEKDLNAFSFYQRKKAFKAKKKDLLE